VKRDNHTFSMCLCRPWMDYSNSFNFCHPSSITYKFDLEIFPHCHSETNKKNSHELLVFLLLLTILLLLLSVTLMLCLLLLILNPALPTVWSAFPGVLALLVSQFLLAPMLLLALLESMLLQASMFLLVT
jgi:hypothetical protein